MNNVEQYFNVCMVSDFFYPSIGGVESHIINLSGQLIRQGHHVVCLTVQQGKFIGRQVVPFGGIDVIVYYLPVPVMYKSNSWLTFYSSMTDICEIFRSEKIEIVHVHQAFSSLAHEAIVCASGLGIYTVFSDHSLFCFNDASSFYMNLLLKVSLSLTNNLICVSYCSKENTAIRAKIKNPSLISVVPNAASDSFSQGQRGDKRNRTTLNIVCVSRLVHRKGIKLIEKIIPNICKSIKDVQFIIAGDGPKRVDLEQMRERHCLFNEVKLIGSASVETVVELLKEGDIFLNSSLTEAFCIAILEAALSGLIVVSTKVGGVPEVLPVHLMEVSEPKAKGKHHFNHLDLENALRKVICRMKSDDALSPRDAIDCQMAYGWSTTAKRVERSYRVNSNTHRIPILYRLVLLCGLGKWTWMFFSSLIIMTHIRVSNLYMYTVGKKRCFSS